jgi:HSP20 family molecular chaperone IbpA
VKVDISIDPTKHVKPLESKSVSSSALKFTTLTKYTYFDSSDKYLKVQLSELAGLKDEKLEVEFGERSLSVKVYGLSEKNYSFAVPKLHAKICPPDCKWQIKANCLQLTLRKKKEDSSWYSLFKQKAIGERESDSDA